MTADRRNGVDYHEYLKFYIIIGSLSLFYTFFTTRYMQVLSAVIA